jgi:Bacterial Ig-like domain (group 3)
MAKRRTPRAASLSEEQRALATAIITDAIVAARQNVAAPPQVPAPASVPQVPPPARPAIDAADEYVRIKLALRTHSEKAATSTALSSSKLSSSHGEEVTFIATVTPSSAGITPTGTVTFMDGADPLDTVMLTTSRLASFKTDLLAVGSHSITAVYGGDSNFTGSTSLALTQTVN